MSAEYGNQIVAKALQYMPNLPEELQIQVSGLQLISEHSSTRRGQYQIQELLKKYVAPMRNKQEFENEMENWRTQLLDEENTKEMLRMVFEEVTGSKTNIPRELQKKTIVAAKKTVETLHGVVWGYNPFTNEREMLEYQNKELWKDFKEKSVESVNIGDKQVMILSLTVEKMINQAEESGLSMKSLGRLARCFVEVEIPSVAAKVNNIHDEDVGEIFNVIEAAIDIEEEMKLIERSMEEVKRAPGKFDLADVVHNYLGKQMKLIQLRTGLTPRDETMRLKILKAAEDITRQALYNLISRETQVHLIEHIQPRYVMTKQELTLEKLIKEATIIEKEKPEWRIKVTMRPPGKLCGTVSTSVTESGVSVNTLAGEKADEKDEEMEESREEGLYCEDEEFEDQQFEDEDGEVFLLSGVRRVQLRPSRKPGKFSPKTGRRAYSPSPYRGKVTMIKRFEKRPPGQKKTGSSPVKPGEGAGRGTPRATWRREGDRKRPGLRNKSPAGKTPSRSPGRRRCLRCYSENHLGANCKRYGKYCATPCWKCKNLGYFPQFHPPNVCLRSSSSDFRNPESRSSSPATRERYGFKASQKRGFSPISKKN